MYKFRTESREAYVSTIWLRQSKVEDVGRDEWQMKLRLSSRKRGQRLFSEQNLIARRRDSWPLTAFGPARVSHPNHRHGQQTLAS